MYNEYFIYPHINSKDIGFMKLYNSRQLDWAMIHLIEGLSDIYYSVLQKNFIIYRQPIYQLYLAHLRATSRTIKTQYQSYILGIKNVYNYINNGIYRNIDSLILLDKFSTALFYGEETYYTNGAFFHVIGLLQMKIDPKLIKMSINDFECSIIEQLSYILQYIVHYTDTYDFVVYSSKYLSRIYDALNYIEKTNKYNKHIEYCNLIKNYKLSIKDNKNTIKKLFSKLGDNKFKLNINTSSLNENIRLFKLLIKLLDNDIIEIPIYSINDLHKK